MSCTGYITLKTRTEDVWEWNEGTGLLRHFRERVNQFHTVMYMVESIYCEKPLYYYGYTCIYNQNNELIYYYNLDPRTGNKGSVAK